MISPFPQGAIVSCAERTNGPQLDDPPADSSVESAHEDPQQEEQQEEQQTVEDELVEFRQAIVSKYGGAAHAAATIVKSGASN